MKAEFLQDQFKPRPLCNSTDIDLNIGLDFSDPQSLTTTEEWNEFLHRQILYIDVRVHWRAEYERGIHSSCIEYQMKK